MTKPELFKLAKEVEKLQSLLNERDLTNLELQRLDQIVKELEQANKFKKTRRPKW